jgi:5'-methylthioadenosine phosphorylase
MTEQPCIGVIGGSGLYEIEGLEDVREVRVETPFGDPSDALVTGTLHGTRLAFLPRHGRGHRFSPSELPYRANIWALRSLGCRHVISVSAVGSMKEGIAPGHLVMVDQFIDRTVSRTRTFFEDGVVAHVGFGEPICRSLSHGLYDAASELKLDAHLGGTYVCIEGPQFSTRAESMLFRSWGVDVIGMTNMPEARLAREAEMCYATIALATDYDCWHEEEAHVSVEGVIATLMANVAKAKSIIKMVAERGLPHGACACQRALEFAVMTDRSRIPAPARERLALFLDPYLTPGS